ncbi:MAG: cob(I)yrinic acid a,c-diamide adenosyltransferase [Desulfobulbaceae bacterium]|nr:cob(I)yrinic acid a,c-diamide adenosyltransferase [Desulfobulbaceae bacterium]
MSKQGIVILYTGDGKGKTTAALGQAIRAVGHGLKICIIQFIKGKWETGEALAAKNHLTELVEFHTLGTGFTWKEEKGSVQEAGRKAWEFAKETISSDKFDLVVLDELTYLVNYGIVDELEVIDLLQKRPARQHVVITGRGASQGIIKASDLATEMRAIKHPYENGIKAQKGVEF